MGNIAVDGGPPTWAEEAAPCKPYPPSITCLLRPWGMKSTCGVFAPDTVSSEMHEVFPSNNKHRS